MSLNTGLFFVFMATAALNIDLKKCNHQCTNSAKSSDPGRYIMHPPSIVA
jgi:hypothetical protein